jgi:glycosyltransferase involved in cell wall biosynthesis
MIKANLSKVPNSPLRVLQVLGSLNRGGIETWLMDVIRNTSREEFVFDACVMHRVETGYEEEFQDLGGRILYCPLSRNLWFFSRRFKDMLRAENFDVIHCHQYYFIGFLLRLAAKAGVPKRIAHIHPAEDKKANQNFRVLFTWWMKRWIRQYGTCFLGPSRESLKGFWGADWEKDSAKHVLYNGINLDRFVKPVDRGAVRSELGIAESAPIVINVSRFVPHKRHEFLVRVAQQVLAVKPDVCFLLIGSGPLQETIKEQVRAKGLEKNFRFITGAPSIDRYWMAADVLAFPSVNEGFGIVIIEAAAAGLKIIAQDISGVGEAATACSDPILLPLDATVDKWTQTLVNALKQPRMLESQRQMLLKQFPFTIENSIEKLRSIYNG